MIRAYSAEKYNGSRSLLKRSKSSRNYLPADLLAQPQAKNGNRICYGGFKLSDLRGRGCPQDS